MKLKFNGEYVFRTGQTIVNNFNPKTKQQKKEDKVMTNEEVNNWIARMKDNQKQLAEEQPDSPPAVLLKPTKVREEIEEFYKTNTITSESGREAYLPLPVLLAPMKEAK